MVKNKSWFVFSFLEDQGEVTRLKKLPLQVTYNLKSHIICNTENFNFLNTNMEGFEI